MDANIRNHIVAIALDQFEPAISSYVLSKEWDKDEVTLDDIKQYAVEKLKECSKVVKVDNETEKPITELIQLITDLLKNEDRLKEMYKKLLNDSIEYLIECKIIKEDVVSGYLKELSI